MGPQDVGPMDKSLLRSSRMEGRTGRGEDRDDFAA